MAADGCPIFLTSFTTVDVPREGVRVNLHTAFRSDKALLGVEPVDQRHRLEVDRQTLMNADHGAGVRSCGSPGMWALRSVRGGT